MSNADAIIQVIKNRRSIFPKSYNNKPISRKSIETILECANYAPTHKLTQPWYFKVFMGEGLVRLADELVRLYRETTTEKNYSSKKKNSIREKIMQSGAVITICMKESGKVPIWEDLAAVACSVQNMWLASSAMEIGAYWSSPSYCKELGPFLSLKSNQTCIGLFYMGYHNHKPKEPKRKPISKKVDWVIE